MRTQLSMVVLAGLIGCAGQASVPPTATAPPLGPTPTATLPSTERFSLSGLPDITLPTSPHTTLLREALLAVETTRAHEPPPAPPWGPAYDAWIAWADAGAAAVLRVDRIIVPLGDSVEARAAKVLATLLREQLLYRVPSSSRRLLSFSQPERDRALEVCVALGEADARLAPWTQRCGELIAYWRADEVWQQRELWPEACPPRHVGGWLVGPMNPTAVGRPALVVHVDSELSRPDEARLAEAVARTLRVKVPDADVVSASEQEAAEQAFIRMRSPEGHACAWPPSPDEQLVSAHPRLWSVHVDARCRRRAHRCALVVETEAVAGSAEGMPDALQTLLETTHPTIDAWEEAASRLAPGSPSEASHPFSRCVGFTYHVPPENFCGESAAFGDAELEAALAPIRPAVEACRDADVALSGGYGVRLDVASDGSVSEVRRLDFVSGPRRVACMTAAFRRARFPPIAAVVVVRGWFEHNAPSPRMRAHFDEDYRGWDEPAVRSRLAECVDPESPVLVVDGTLHIARNGITSRVDGEATDATSVCVRNALVGSVWPCTGERDIAMRLCIGQPEAPVEPVRP